MANEIHRTSRRFLTLVIAILALSAGLHANSHSTKAKGKISISSWPPLPAPVPVKRMVLTKRPITIEIFSDYQCPICGRFYEETLRPLIQDYVATGKGLSNSPRLSRFHSTYIQDKQHAGRRLQRK